MGILLIVSACTANEKKLAFENKATEANDIRYEENLDCLGIGLASFNSEFCHQHTITIYNDSVCDSVFMIWNFDSLNKYIRPKFYYSEYGIVEFILIDTLRESLEIAIDANSFKFIKRDSCFLAITWKEYLLGSYGVKLKADYIIRDSISETFRINPKIGQSNELFSVNSFCVDSVNDDWVHLIYDCKMEIADMDLIESGKCSGYIDKCQPPRSLWIKWRDSKEIFLRISTML